MDQPFVVIVPIGPLLKAGPEVMPKPEGNDYIVAPKPYFFVRGVIGVPESAFIPEGTGWTPNKLIDLLLLGEPGFEGGKVITSMDWKPMGTLTVDQHGAFGYNGGAFKFLVQRTIPVAPPMWLGKPVVLARERDTANLRVVSIPNDPWFTF